MIRKLLPNGPYNRKVHSLRRAASRQKVSWIRGEDNSAWVDLAGSLQKDTAIGKN
jgi:hypothetical protein